MPNVALIDNDFDGPDNRPAPESPVSLTGALDASGQARVTFTVTMQPGNNYRAGASCLSDAPGQADQAKADLISLHTGIGEWEGYDVPLTWSKMLTVWRKLWLEVDSMDAENQDQGQDTMREQNDYEWARFIVPAPSMDIPAPIKLNVPDQGFTTLLGYMIGDLVPCDPSYDNQWEGGALVPIGTSTEYLIVRNSCTVVSGQTISQFILWGNPGDLSDVTSYIRDDDPFFTGGAPRQLPQLSVLTPEITAAYADAYIEVLEAPGELNPRSVVPWDSNLSTADLWTDYNFGSGVGANWDLVTEANYWVRRVVVCYQGNGDEDFDSDQYENASVSQNVEVAGMAPYPSQSLSSLQGTVDPATKSGLTIRGAIFSGTALTTVYKETIRDKDIRTDTGKFWQYVAHEVGHQTVGTSGFASGEESDHSEGGLLTGGSDLQNLLDMQSFSAQSCLRFRSTVKW